MSDAAAAEDASHDPGKQARIDQGIPIIGALDGFRAAAIFAVVILHLFGAVDITQNHWVRTALRAMASSVDILFILSGFVVFLPTVARGGDFGSRTAYAIRRAARLLPAYWLCLAIVALFLALWPGPSAPANPGLLDYGGHVLAIHDWVHLFDAGFPLGLGIDGALWTLTVELTFYAILPLIASAWFRRPLLGLAISALITIGWKLAAADIGPLLAFVGVNPSLGRLLEIRYAALGEFPAFAFCFGLGMTSAWAYVRLRQTQPKEVLERWAGRIQPLALVGLVICAYLFGRGIVGHNNVATLLAAREKIVLNLALDIAYAAIMLATALAVRRRQMPFALPRARALGDISYGIYLIHLPTFYFLRAEFSDDGLWDALGGHLFLALIGVPIAIGFGWLSARLLETPVRQWARRYGRRTAIAGATR